MNLGNNRISVRFEDFWSDFNPSNNFIINSLKKIFTIEIVEDNNRESDILFFSNFGINNIKWKNCLRIYITGEADVPDFNISDYAIGLADLKFTDRYLRYPFFFLHAEEIEKIQANLKNKSLDSFINRKSFCFLVSNPRRNPIFFDFIEKLNKYKTIYSGGKWNNNIGKSIIDKFNFLNNYKFNIVFENELIDGYVTEKIYHSIISHSLPIYWGSDYVKIEHSGNKFINICDFENLDSAIDYIINLDNDNDLYQNYLNQQLTQKNLIYENIEQSFINFIKNAVKRGKRINFERGVNNRLFSRFEALYNLQNNKFYYFYTKIKSFF